MPHARTTMRNALQTELGSSVVSATLEMERRLRLDVGSAPSVIVSLTDSTPQESEYTMGTPGTIEEQQQIDVEITVVGGVGDNGAAVAALVDQIELEVEAGVANDLTLGGVTEDVIPSSSTYETNVDQDRVIGVRRIQYLAQWRHAFGAPDSPEG